MLRQPVAALLRADDDLLALLTGGVWPTEERQATLLTRETYPTSFANGEVRPVALVNDDGSFPYGDVPGAVSSLVRIYCWQQRGRETIEAAQRRIYGLLEGARVAATGAWVYEFRFAGDGPPLADRNLGGAEQGWSRWQAITVRG